MQRLSPVAARFESLAELRAYKGECQSFMSAPLPFTPAALAYVANLDLAYSGKATAQTPNLFPHNLTIHDRAGELNAQRVESLLQDGLPKLPGRQSFIETLVEAHEAFNAIKLTRFNEQATVFSLEIGNYVPRFNWHRDDTAIITLRGPATCWLPDERNTDAWQMMPQQSFNIWDQGIKHSGPSLNMKTEPRLLAVMI